MLKALKEYIIPFAGLSNEVHVFEFKPDNTFLEANEIEDPSAMAATLEVEMDKKENMMVFRFDFNGHATFACDRCTDPVSIPLAFNNQLIFKFGDESQGTEDIIYLPDEAYEIDLVPYIIDFLIVSIPARIVHEEGDCDPEMIKLLEKMGEKPEETDPRWDKLGDLKL